MPKTDKKRFSRSERNHPYLKCTAYLIILDGCWQEVDGGDWIDGKKIKVGYTTRGAKKRMSEHKSEIEIHIKGDQGGGLILADERICGEKKQEEKFHSNMESRYPELCISIVRDDGVDSGITGFKQECYDYDERIIQEFARHFGEKV